VIGCARSAADSGRPIAAHSEHRFTQPLLRSLDIAWMRRDRLLIVLLIVIRRRSNGRSAVHGGNVALRALDRLDAAIPVATMATALRKRGTICRHVFHLSGRRIKGFRKAMQLTGHKTEAVYRRYAITNEADLRRRRAPQ
jgi:hypothetical protein